MSTAINQNALSVQHKEPGEVMKIMLCILVLLVMTLSTILYFAYGMRYVAQAQLSAMQSGDMLKAYDLTSPQFKKQTSLADFESYIASNPIFKNYKHVSFNEKKVENGAGFLNGVIEDASGTQYKIEYQLVKDKDRWTVQFIRVTPMEATTDVKPEGKLKSVAPAVKSEADMQAASKDAQVTKSKPASVVTLNDDTGMTIHAVLINDVAGANGYVQSTKTVLSSKSPMIYATVQIIAPKSGGKVEAQLIQSNGAKIGPAVGTLDKSGNVMKAFTFARSGDAWPKGKYSVIVNLSSGRTKAIDFDVK